MPSTIVSIAAGAEQVIVIKKAKEMGLAVIAVDRNRNAPGFSYVDEALYLSTYRPKPIIKALKKLSRKYNLKGIITRSSGPPVITAATVAESFQLPGSGIKAAKNIVDKAKLIALCKKLRLTSPQHWTLSSIQQLKHIKNSLIFPLVVKPALGLVGKKSILLVKNTDELKSVFSEVKEASLNRYVQIERYIEGQDVILMSMVRKSKLLPIVLLDENNHFNSQGRLMTKGLSIPSIFSEKKQKRQIINFSQSIVKAIKLQTSPFIISCRCQKNQQPVLIEIHLDLGGDRILEDLLPKSTNFDFIKFAITIMAGKKVKLSKIKFKKASIKNLA